MMSSAFAVGEIRRRPLTPDQMVAGPKVERRTRVAACDERPSGEGELGQPLAEVMVTVTSTRFSGTTGLPPDSGVLAMTVTRSLSRWPLARSSL